MDRVTAIINQQSEISGFQRRMLLQQVKSEVIKFVVLSLKADSLRHTWIYVRLNYCFFYKQQFVLHNFG